MTRGRAVGLAVGVSVLVTSLAWIGLLAAMGSVSPRCSWSDVVPPMSAVIADMSHAADEGRGDDVKRKLHLLNGRWEAFHEGGDAPSLFFEEIVAIGAPAEAEGD